MKKRGLLLLLASSISLHSESILQQFKKGAQEIKNLANQILEQKQQLEGCLQNYKKLEQAEKTLAVQYNELEQREKTLAMIKDEEIEKLRKEKQNLSDQIDRLRKVSSRRVGPPPPPPGAFENKALVQENNRLKNENEKLKDELKKRAISRKSPITATGQTQRKALLEDIRKGTRLRKTQPTDLKDSHAQNSLEDALARRRKHIAGDRDEDEEESSEWED